MPDDDVLTPPPAASAASAAVISTADPVSIVNLVLVQMGELERRLGAKIDSNAASAMRRWEHHDQEHRTLSEAVGELKRQFDAHLQAERDEDLVMEARLGPVKRAGAWLVREWRTVAIAGLVVVDVVSQAVGILK